MCNQEEMMITIKGTLPLWLKIPNWNCNHKLQQWWDLGRNTDPKRMGQRLKAAHLWCGTADHCKWGQAETMWWIIRPENCRRLWEASLKSLLPPKRSVLSPHQCLCCNPPSRLQQKVQSVSGMTMKHSGVHTGCCVMVWCFHVAELKEWKSLLTRGHEITVGDAGGKMLETISTDQHQHRWCGEVGL